MQNIVVSSSDLTLIASNIVLKNNYAHSCTPAVAGGRGVVNTDYMGDANSAPSVAVPRQKTYTMSLGNLSSGFANGIQFHTTQNDNLMLNIDKIFLQIVDIPYTQSQNIQFNIMETNLYNVAQGYRTLVDIATIKEIYDKTIAYGAGLTTPYSNVIKSTVNAGLDIPSADVKSMLNSAWEKMTNLPANDYDMSTPVESRSLIAKNRVIQALRDNGLILVGSDSAFKTFVAGINSISVPEGYKDSAFVTNQSYVGTYYGFDCFVGVNTFFPTPYAGEVYGIVTHYSATTRATKAFLSRTVQNVAVQGSTTNAYIGDQLQCQGAFGVLCTRPWIPQILVSNDFALTA